MNTKDRQVVPSMELLSDMEAVQIYGGIGQPQNDPDDFNLFCKGKCNTTNCSNCGVNCSNCATHWAKCDCTVIQPKTGTDDCTVIKAVGCGS